MTGPVFPITMWHYLLRLEVRGSDRRNLPDALEGEDLAIFRTLAREEAYEQIRSGEFRFEASFREPLAAFPDDLATLSLYLFQVVKGFEMAERFVSPTSSDDTRAWKVVARQGEWVKFPLLVRAHDDGTFHVDEDADDLEVLAARWGSYPGWFQDGMRRKHPSLRSL